MKKWFSLALAAGLVCFVGCGDTGTVEGEGGKKLSLTVPSTAVGVKQNDSETFEVSVERTKFEDPIELEVSNLPEGVTLVEESPKIAKGQDSVTLTLKASAEATPLEGHEAKVTAKGGGMEKTMPFKININKSEAGGGEPKEADK